MPSATPSTSGGLESPPPTKPRALKRKRKSDSPHPDPLPVIVTQKIPDLASFETVVFLWDRLRLLSDSASDLGQIDDHQSRYKASMQSSPRRQRLEMLWSRIGANAKNERWNTVLRRIYQAEFFGQYLEERARFDNWKAQKAERAKRCRTTCTEETDAEPPSHPLEEYVDLCFPKTIL